MGFGCIVCVLAFFFEFRMMNQRKKLGRWTAFIYLIVPPRSHTCDEKLKISYQICRRAVAEFYHLEDRHSKV